MKPLAVETMPPIGSLVVLAASCTRGDASLVKRVSSHGSDRFAVSSDNPSDARDSRHFGSVEPADCLGLVRVIFTKRGELRLVRDASERRAKKATVS